MKLKGTTYPDCIEHIKGNMHINHSSQETKSLQKSPKSSFTIELGSTLPEQESTSTEEQKRHIKDTVETT